MRRGPRANVFGGCCGSSGQFGPGIRGNVFFWGYAGTPGFAAAEATFGNAAFSLVMSVLSRGSEKVKKMSKIFIPAARERVRVRGRAGVFFVLAVDREEEIAHVINVETESESQLHVEAVQFTTLVKLGAEENNDCSASVA